MLSVLLCLCLFANSARGQSLSSHANVGNFTCDRSVELVSRTAQTGSVRSPCFNGSAVQYPQELTSGVKIVNITYESPYLHGYRLTFRRFGLFERDRLYIGEGLVADVTSSRVVRNISVTTSTATTNPIIVRIGEDGLILQTLNEGGSRLFENYKTILMDFYTISSTTGGVGFLIDYEADINPCLQTGADVYCKNNGKCTRSGFNAATCNCTGTGYEGATCETDVNECTAGTHNCDVDADCANTNGSFTCTCKSGFTGNGTTCADIDNCVGNPCGATGTCVDRIGTYNCTCNPGYEGGVGGPCNDTNECAAGATNRCADNTTATCTNTVGNHTCACRTGYTGDGITCLDINECTSMTHSCDANATCTNTNGSYNCMCNAGLTGDGRICDDINECETGAHDCHANATCTNIPFSWNCSCKTGFTGNGTFCNDVNECTSGSDNCHANATCTNNVGSFTCACNPGYTGTGTSCTDVNECATGAHDCDSNATCTNNDGSFTCACNTGYSGDGKTCADINECATGDHNCDTNATCMNNPGSFSCMCNTGYSGNGITCTDINECTLGTHKCGVNADCSNTVGNYTCTCKPGFTGDAFVNCTDIDECASNTHNCTATESTCRNIPGSFECVCNSPIFRGQVNNCNYYCGHNTTCLQDRNGYIDVPLFWDGVKFYDTFDETDFKFNTSSNGTGIRFTFLAFNTEPRDDFLSIYRGSNAVDTNLEIVAISASKAQLYNARNPVAASGQIEKASSGVTAYLNLTGSNPTLTLNSSDIFVQFTSDRLNASTGFLISFEYDKDDCVAGIRNCKNATGCTDKTFAYQCNCNTGYTGVDCDLNIDECGFSGSSYPCAPSPSANCTDTVGSYLCACNSDYIGNGTVCQPHLVLSNYQVTPTVTSLLINFGITAAWRNVDYIQSFRIIVVEGSITTNYVTTLADFIANNGLLVTGLKPHTQYNVTIEVNTTGSLYSTAVFNNTLGMGSFLTLDANASVPMNFSVPAIAKRDRATLSWMRPQEAGFGRVTHYEICYAPATDTKTQAVAALRNIPLTFTCMIVDDTYTSITLVNLPMYMSLSFKIRAFSVFGAGNYTSVKTAFTGDTCTPWTGFSTRIPCPTREALLESTSFPRTPTDVDNVIYERQWSFNLASFRGWRPNFLYFNTFPQESSLDAGYGDIDVTNHDTERNNRNVSFTGAIASGPQPTAGYVTNSSNPSHNIVWLAFISDRTRKRQGFQVEVEVDGNNCDSTPCLHDGNCTNLLYDYSCKCAPEWTGKSCEIPQVKPTVTCTPGKTDAAISFTIPAQWTNDETVVGGFSVAISPNGTSANPATRVFGATNASFSGLTAYTDHTVTVTVTTSMRSATLVADTTTCRTLEDIPSAPQNVAVTAPGSRNLAVTWNAPALPNGIVTYVVVVTSTDHATYGETEATSTSPAQSATSYTATGLRDYRQYSVVVYAITSAGNISASASGRTNAGPAPGISGSITAITNSSVRVEWTLSNTTFVGPVTITITAVSTIHNPTSISLPPGTASPYRLAMLQEGVSYNITVSVSTGTTPDQSFTRSNVSTNEIAPGLPATFTYNRATSTFTWTAPPVLEQNGVITGYLLTDVSAVPGFTPVRFNATTLSYQLNGLPPFTPYNFTLQAINSVGNGQIFHLAITTREAVPNPVTSFTQAISTATTITISWVAQSPPVGNTFYRITYTDGITPVSLTSALTTQTLTGLRPYTNYTISVTAGTNAGDAAVFTQTIQTAEGVPGQVQNLRATYGTTQQYTITVTWDPPTTPNGVITQYKVAYSASPANEVNVTGQSHTITGVTKSNTTYKIDVTAWTSAGEGTATRVNVQTPILVPDAPTNVVVTAINSNSAAISADPPANSASIPVISYTITVSQVPSDCVAKGDVTCIENRKNSTTSLPFTISGLPAYRLFNVTVSATSAGGEGPKSEPRQFSTTAGAPGTPAITNVQAVPGGFDVTLNASTPFTGPANYTITATVNGVSVSATVGPTSNLTGIVVPIRGLNGSANYTITAAAVNGQGQATPSPETIRPSSPSAPMITVARTSSSQLTVAITSVTGAVNYTVSYVRQNCTSCTAITEVITGTSYPISSLLVYTEYRVSVFATSSAGDGIKTTVITRTRVGTPTLINPNFRLTQPNDSTAATTTTARVVNLCTNKGSIVDETTGPITSIAYYVRQSGSNQLINASTIVYYSSVQNQNPSPLYRTITIQCSTSTRKKRQTTSNSPVEIGTANCNNNNGECNGPLRPSTTYTFEACALNEDNNYVCTGPTEPYTTAALPPTRQLTAGEIAAIVICSILLLILIILLIVYIVKRRKHRSGSHEVSRKGTDNPSFESKQPQQQRYQVDPAAAPQTEYSSEAPQA